jgi:hypothetical protein
MKSLLLKEKLTFIVPLAKFDIVPSKITLQPPWSLGTEATGLTQEWRDAAT